MISNIAVYDIFQLNNAELSPTGQQILSTYQSEWNRNDENRQMWNYGDCWPIYLFNDAGELVEWFSGRFMRGKDIIELS